MKTKHFPVVVAVVSICLLAAALIHASDKHLLTSHTPLQIEYSYMAGDSVSIQMDAFELKAPVNSLIHDMTISLTLIPHRQGIAMPSRMYYRGMPMAIGGTPTYGTARDFGNFAAGYIAGRNGLGILPTLFGFDVYQGSIEPSVSRIPQLRGYLTGIVDHFINLLH